MANDIELVIKMPEELKEALDNAKKENAFDYMQVYNDTIYDAIKNGISLPKDHGRLLILSENKLKENLMNLDFSCQKWIGEVDLYNSTVAIIETESEDNYG